MVRPNPFKAIDLPSHLNLKQEIFFDQSIANILALTILTPKTKPTEVNVDGDEPFSDF
jgi:hypothetical protein